MKNLLLLSVIFVCTSAFAQKSDSVRQGKYASILSIHAGIGFPGGDFGATDLNNAGSGFAERGYAAGLSLWVLPKKYFSLGLDYTFLSHQISKTVINKIPVGSSFPVSSDSWNLHIVSLGPYARFGEDKLKYFAGVQGGAAISISPFFIFMGQDSLQKVKKNPLTFAVKAFAGAEYQISSNTWLRLGASWVYTKAVAKYERIYESQEQVTDPVTGQIYYRTVYTSSLNTVTKPVSDILISLGLTFRL